MSRKVYTFHLLIACALSGYLVLISCGISNNSDIPPADDSLNDEIPYDDPQDDDPQDDEPPVEDLLAAELLATGVDKYIELIPYSSHAPYSPDPSWEIYEYDTSVCKCITGAPFHIGVKRKTATDNVVILLSGGGACWPGQEGCYTTTSYETGHDDSAGDVLNGWSVIHVPYCDGSIHMGDNDADYNGDGVADHFHQGLRTTSAAISIMLELFPDPPKIYITGSSAGGYGTLITYMLVRRFFPDSVIYIFNDSGPGLINPDNMMSELTEFAWNYNQFFPVSCPLCLDQMMYFYDWILEKDPAVKIALFSSYYDSIIGSYFLEMENQDYKDLLLSVSGYIRLRHPGSFKRFLINGESHTLTNTPGGVSYTVRGTSIKAWLDQMITGDESWGDIIE